MTRYEVKQLPDARDVLAPDGSEVRVLLALQAGSMAHFCLAPGKISKAVLHRTVEEIWYFISGVGEMWLQNEDQGERIVTLGTGLCLTIPLGTCFQFRSLGPGALAAIAVTMPPWPGGDQAILVPGKWQPTVD
jgi:mannose-6-phosphate isomerase-like protein (cupin superfamily)